MWTSVAFVLVVQFLVNIKFNECAHNTTDYESLANNILSSSKNEYISLQRELHNYTWQFDTSRKIYTRKAGDQLTPIDHFREFAVKLSEKLKVIPYANFNSTLLQWQVKRMSDLQIDGLDDHDYHRAKDVLSKLANLARTAKVCSYRNQSICSLSYLPNINDCIIRTKTPKEMEYYWNEWRQAIKDKSRPLFKEYVEFYRKAAAFNGHITPSRTWCLHFEGDDMLTELSRVMQELKPLYSEFHAYVRHQLRREYGEETMSDDDPIAEHLIEQVLLHAWRQHSVVTIPHPEKHLPNVKESMIRLRYNSYKIISSAEDFYRSLGFEKLSSSFWSDYMQMIPENADDHDCKSQVYDIYPEVGLRYCTKIDFRKLMQMHGTMATVFYNLQKSELPIGLDREVFPGFGNIIGEAVILSASTPRHLENVGLIENYSVDKELNLNRLFRLGTHTLLSIPMYFANEKFWVDALDYRIKDEDYNCGYWKIKEEFTGVQPPDQRSEQTLDPGYRFYSGLDDKRSSTVKLLSEIMGYQIYKGLCLKTGQYIPDDPNYPLHNCDFYKQREAGHILKKIMSLGASKSWRELLEMVTGETTLSAKAILEFYEPLYVWLKDFNADNDINVGWDITEKCEKDV